MKEKVILIGVNYQKQSNFENSLAELKNLAIGLEYDILETFTQNLNKINNVYYIGKGKLAEVKEYIDMHDVKKVIFNDELTPSQVRNIVEVLDCTVLDRSNLILDIFTKRASSKESKLQVEIAKLQYMLPRLADSSLNLSRQRGGSVINRGSGETKLETERRQIEAKIKALKKELETIVTYRQIQRNLRQKSEVKIVSLVGYTNAGKSTILNEMMTFKKEVLEKDMLFATLDTSVRQINNSFLLTDTVGFIDKLPHHLIKAFRSTLEEVQYADLLLHVVDYSHPNYVKQMEVVLETLKDIGIENKSIITVYNKIDLTINELPEALNNEIYISAKNPKDIQRLKDYIMEQFNDSYCTCKIFIPYSNSEIIHYFYENAVINSTTHDEKGTIIDMTCKKSDYKRFQKYLRI